MSCIRKVPGFRWFLLDVCVVLEVTGRQIWDYLQEFFNGNRFFFYKNGISILWFLGSAKTTKTKFFQWFSTVSSSVYKQILVCVISKRSSVGLQNDIFKFFRVGRLVFFVVEKEVVCVTLWQNGSFESVGRVSKQISF